MSKNHKYTKTVSMNLVAAIGWGVTGVALFLSKLDSLSAGALTSIFISYAFIVAIPAFTAKALTSPLSPKLNKVMVFSNAALIVLWAVATIASIYTGDRVGLALAGVVAFVIPEVINIQALRALIKQGPSPNENPAEKPLPSAAKPKGTSMKILIVDRETTNTVYTTEVYLQGQNYAANNEERFGLAWKAAVEDGAVKPEDRVKYAFIVSTHSGNSA